LIDREVIFFLLFYRFFYRLCYYFYRLLDYNFDVFFGFFLGCSFYSFEFIFNLWELISAIQR